MRKAVLIANPSASQFTGRTFRDVSHALAENFAVVSEWPVSAVETVEVTKRAAADGIEVVFAMGGDGVTHHVANALVGTETALGLLPAGTTNVLARILGIPLKPARAATAAATMEPLGTRMIRVTADTPYGTVTRFATFALGVGFDADVVEEAETRPFAKSRFGGVHYARTAVGRLLSSWRTALPNLRLECTGASCDGDRFDAVVALTQVHDPYTFFGNVPLHLTSTPPEGVAMLAASDLAVGRSTEIFLRALLRRPHREASGTRLWTDFTRIVIEAEPPSPFQADGEHLGMATRLVIEPMESAVTVLRPASDQV